MNQSNTIITISDLTVCYTYNVEEEEVVEEEEEEGDIFEWR